MQKLYYAEGTIEVTAKGFWFTSGGEKGSFGYYPHLKNGKLPVYPDTQIHGDLRMAVSWLLKLKNKEEYNEDDVNKIFGDIPKKDLRESSSKVFITDLKPSNSNIVTFSIKPRIAIGDDRTTKEDMLVNFECAYFNNEPLTAKIYLGYFKDKKELEEAIYLIKDAASLLSGFGAFRSRGFGRGQVNIEFKAPINCCESDVDEMCVDYKKSDQESHITLILKPLVNFRSKLIDPGRSQLLDASGFISSAQIRGWFVKSYADVIGNWPSAEQMKSIVFADFYPSFYDANLKKWVLGYPHPVSTAEFENKDIVDTWRQEDKTDEEGTERNKIRGKLKPLSAKYFVTAEDAPRLIELKTDIRMRNSTNPNFSTKDTDGLFAHEFVMADNYFGGKIKLAGNDTSFINNALRILCSEKIKPIINGAIFEKNFCEFSTDEEISANDKPFFVISAINYDNIIEKTLKDKENAIQITLDTQRRYNVELKRPRRNRIVVATGSILSFEKADKTIKWRGFGKEIFIKSKDDGKTIENEDSPSPLSPDRNQALKMSRSQAGQLREFLSPVMSGKLMEKIITERINKYNRWNKDEDKISKRLVPKKVFTEIKSKLEDKSEEGGLKAAQKYIMDLLDEYKLAQWEVDYKKTLKKFHDAAKEKGYIND